MSSVILLLYNAIIWPEMKASICKEDMSLEPNELKRAKLFTKPLDVLITSVTTLMNMMTEMAEGKMKLDKKNLIAGGKLVLYKRMQPVAASQNEERK